jgi:biopolymer transport protein ExbD
MKLQPQPARPSPDWQLQLINIVFLLLLFFVTNGTISNIRDFSIELPSTMVTAGGGPVGDAAHIDARGNLKFQGEAATATEIAAFWFDDDGTPPRPRDVPFQIVADRRLPATSLIERLREFKAAGFENLSIVTIREFGHAQ